MTNDEFLSWLFAEKAEEEKIFTVSFPGSPSNGDYRATPFLHPEHNNYFCVSTLSTVERRTPKNCLTLYALVVDDVVEKIPPGEVFDVLGTPSYIIETSANSCQYGYKLDPPVREVEVAEGLVQALCRRFTGDMSGRNRLARLPEGRNGKPGKNDFKSELVFFAPDTRLTLGHAVQALGATKITPVDHAAGPVIDPANDPVLKAVGWYEATSEPGIYKVHCPWVADHTGGRQDGAFYLAPSGFKCWHGHCADKTFFHFREFLGISFQDVERAVTLAEFGIQPQQTANPPAKTHPWLKQTVRQFFDPETGKVYDKAQRQKLFPRHWLFENLVPMGTPWAISGEGGLGKSRMALAMCMSIVSGVPLSREIVPSGQGSVLFLTQEDDYCDKAHRFITQYERLAEEDPAWRPDKVAHSLMDNLYIPNMNFGQNIDPDFVSIVEAFVRDAGHMKLVLFDPLTLFWNHANIYESINSASGTISTFKKLIDVARVGHEVDSQRWSCGISHHISKAGELYGSVMIANHVRTLFTMTETQSPEGQHWVDLTVSKTNATNKKGKIFTFSLDKESAAVYPVVDFGHMSIEERVAALVHDEKSVSATDIKKKFPATDIKDILDKWKAEKGCSRLGVKLGKYGRYESATVME